MNKIKIALLFILACCIAWPLTAQAKNIIPRGQWGANEEWTFVPGGGQSGTSTANENPTEDGRTITSEADAEIERIVTKDSNGKTYLWPLEYAKEIKFIVIHYTAVMNNLDNPLQDIKNIYHSHAVGNKWGDIGYHYLIDRQGNIYEGRKGGDYVTGGHAKPVNKVSVGIALMGNYENEELPAEMVEATVDLLNYLTKKYNIDPLGKTEYKGKTYPNIHGHSDNSAKLDPGKFFQQKFQYIRKLMQYIQSKKKKTKPVKYNFTPLDAAKFIVTPPDKEKNFLVRVKNTGEITWNDKTYLENPNEPDLPRVFAKLGSEKKVEPGKIGLFRGTLEPTLISGMKMPMLNLVINGAIHPKKSFPVPIMVEKLEATYEIVDREDPPQTTKAGQTAKAWIILKNTGNFTWKRTGENAVYITTSEANGESLFFKGKTIAGRLAEQEVRPGETGKFIFYLRTPKKDGSQYEYVKPVIKGVGDLQGPKLFFLTQIESAEKPLRVALSMNGKKPQIKSETGMVLYEDTKKMHTFQADETVTVARLKSGGYRVRTQNKKITLREPPRFKAPNNGILTIVNFENRPAWNLSLNDNMFRGVLEIREVDDKLVVINELPLEDYLKGIAEISNGDPPEKIKTIIILARSYAKYYRDIGEKFPGKPYDLDDDPNHTQKYVGYGLELRSPNIVSAVQETTGKIVTYEGRQIITPYFNQSDGKTRSAQEVWGWKDAPYLQSVPDTFCGSIELKGHGVGLSGCGASALAREGKTAEEIIKYYYKGIEITD